MYFIKDPDSKAIKIGVSKNPERRLKQLQTGDVGHNLYFMKLIKTNEMFVLEKELHKRFRTDRISQKGEWFKPSKELVKFVDSIKENDELKQLKKQRS